MKQQADWQRSRLRDRIESIKARAEKSTSWRTPAGHLTRLINSEGVVPIKTRLTREDLAFLSRAREDLAAFAELALRIVELHRPKDAGGLSSDPESPIRRCGACMWRWPCPSYRAVIEAVER